MDTLLYNVLTDPERLQALAATALLDSPPEETFDRLTRMAARSVGAPVALVSLVTDQRQFFKSCIGLPEPWASRRGTPLTHSFCQYTVATNTPLIVDDARLHALLVDSPAITELQIVAYAGFPLRTPSGQVIGSLCAIDHEPRQWDESELATLHDLASIVSNEIARHHALNELRRTSSHLAAMLRQRSEVIWAVNRDLRLTLFNVQYVEYLQLTLNYTPTMGASIFERVPPERVETWRRRYNRAFAGESFSVEDSVTVGATEYWFETTFCPIVEDGAVVEVSVLARDCTQQKVATTERIRILADAQTARAQMTAILERIHDAFFALDADWNFTYLNSRAEQLLQSNAAALIGRNFWDIYPDALQSPFLAQFQDQVAQGEPVTFEAYYPPFDAWFDVRLYPGHDGISVYFHDVTARHRLEAQNRIQARALDAIMQAVVVLDHQLHVLYQNAAATALFGAAETSVAQLAALLVTPASLADAQRILTNAHDGGSHIAELELIRADGVAFPALVTVAPIAGDVDQHRRIVAVITDLTEQKRAASERLRMERDLLESQRLESLGLLAGGVAHDFNNLLTVIMGHANLARAIVAPTSPVVESLDEIMLVARRAADLTHQMLAYAGKGRIVVEPVDVSALIAEMASLVRASLPGPIPVSYNLTPDLPFIEADPAQIRQIVLNLVLNAAEALPGAHGQIIVRTYSTTDPVPAVVLEVADTGSGMPPEVQERIFEPFFTTKFTGRGLGLAAVQGVVRQHHGSIRVQSSPGKGSYFYIMLPLPQTHLSRPAAPAPEPERTPSPPSSTPLLIVDDELSVRTITERLLTRWGYQVAGVGDGAQAIELLRTSPHHFRLALVDWTMPGIHGSELFAALTATQPDLRIVVMSGYNEEALRNEVARPNIVGFLHKPFGAEQLRRLLEDLALDAPDTAQA